MPDPTSAGDGVVRLVRAYAGTLRRQVPPPGLQDKVVDAVRRRHRGARVARLAGSVAVIGAILVAGGAATAVHLGILGRPSTTSITPTLTSTPTPTPTPQEWQAVALPSGLEGVSRVSCVGHDECWLMGYSSSSNLQSIWQYASGTWTSASISGAGGLADLACVTTDDCWAVGSLVPPGTTSDGVLQPLIEHDAGEGFSAVSSPPMTGLDELNAVACPGPDDCWAVGRYGSQSIVQNPGSSSATETLVSNPLVEHYNGTGWTEVTVPAPSANGQLSAVFCVSAEDCWAAGQEFEGGVFFEHYSGSGWALVSSPPVGGGPGDALDAVSCPAVNDCWAVGSTGQSAQATEQPLVEHYTGGGWTVVSPRSARPTVVFSTASPACPRTTAGRWAEERGPARSWMASAHHLPTRTRT
ncbi:MAG: hypothetical protein ACLQGJ_01910 [Candidatus Dormibacteria bacterium]